MRMPASARALIDAVFDETSRIDELMSTFKDISRISEMNRDAAERPVYAGHELFALIRGHTMSRS